MNGGESAVSPSEVQHTTQKDLEMSNLLEAQPFEMEKTAHVQMEIEAIISQQEVTPTKEVVSIVQPDGGWGWVVCLSCAVCTGFMFGIMNSFGILYVYIREKYAEDGLDDISFKASWVGSVCIGLTFLVSAVAGVISDVIGVRKTGLIGGVVALAGILSSAFVQNVMLLYLTFGVLIGVGFSMMFSQSFVILGHYFKRRLGLANGLMHMGQSLLTIPIALMLPESLDTLGLQKTFLVLSGLIFLMIPCTLTWKAILPRRRTQTIAREGDVSCKPTKSNAHSSLCIRLPKIINTDIFRNKKFMTWVLAMGISLPGLYIPLVHLVKFSDDEFPGHRGSLAVLFFAAGGTVARPLVGRLADLHCVRRLSIQLVSFAIVGTCTICLPFCHTYWALMAVVIILGGSYGVCTSMAAPVVFEFVGELNAAQAMGFLLGTSSIPLTAGPPLAGLLYDHLGNYKVAFHVAGCFPLFGAFMILFIRQPATTDVTL